MWVVSTSALLLGVPYALSIADEQQMVEMEKEQKMREMGNEVGVFSLFVHRDGSFLVIERGSNVR